MTTTAVKPVVRKIEDRLDSVGWGLLFLVSGVIMLIPDAPRGSWLAGIGVILVGITITKWALRVEASWFTLILGIVGFVTGLGEMAGQDVPGLSLFLILCGLALIGAQVVRRPEAG